MRTVGVTRPRRAADSSSRTARESSEITSPLWRTRRCFRGAARRAPVWRWPVRATNSSSEIPGTAGTAACRSVPPTSPAQGQLLRTPSGLADLRGSTQQTTAGIPYGPGAAGGCAGRYDMQSHRRATGPILGRLPTTTRARTHNSRPRCPLDRRRRLSPVKPYSAQNSVMARSEARNRAGRPA